MPIPTFELPLRLSKFDVAERQLLQAIRLFFKEEDEVSIQTLSEAAAQVLYDIGKDDGVTSIVRDSNLIRPEMKKEWFDAVFASRNFFKHANTDKKAFHEFDPFFNDMSILDAVIMYHSLKKRWTPETSLFFVWFGLKHPHLIENDSELKISLAAIGTAPTANNKMFFAQAINAVRSGTLTMPNVVMYFGISEL